MTACAGAGIEEAASPSRCSQQAAAVSGHIRPPTQLTRALPRSTSLIGSRRQLSRAPMAPSATPLPPPDSLQDSSSSSHTGLSSRSSVPSAGDQPLQGQVMDDRLPLGLSTGGSGPQRLTLLRQQGAGLSSGQPPLPPHEAAQRSGSLAQPGGLTRAALGLASGSLAAAWLAADPQQTFSLSQQGQEQAGTGSPTATAGAQQRSGSLAAGLRRARSADLDAPHPPLSALVPEPQPVAAPAPAPQASTGTAQPRRASLGSRNSSLGGLQPSRRAAQEGSRSSLERLGPTEGPAVGDPVAAHAAVSQPLFAALALAQGLNAGLGSIGPRESIPDPSIVRQLLAAAVAMHRQPPAAQPMERMDDAQRSLNQLTLNNEALVETLDAAEDTIALLTPILESSSTSYFSSDSSVQPAA